MYIKLLKRNAIDYIKNNYVDIHKKTKDSNIRKVLANELITDWYEESKFVNRTISFYMPKDINPRHSDYENAKLVYEEFNELTESQASDERLWAGYSITDDVYSYLKYRWKDHPNVLKYRVTFHAGTKRGLLYHGIARLWWLAHLTIDDTKTNKYELTEFTFKYPHIMEKMIYRNFSNSKHIRHGIIEGIQEYLNNDGQYSTAKIDDLYLHISTISSVNLLDSYSKNEIKQITIDFLLNYDKN